jgi:hypothetical protein
MARAKTIETFNPDMDKRKCIDLHHWQLLAAARPWSWWSKRGDKRAPGNGDRGQAATAIAYARQWVCDSFADLKVKNRSGQNAFFDSLFNLSSTLDGFSSPVPGRRAAAAGPARGAGRPGHWRQPQAHSRGTPGPPAGDAPSHSRLAGPGCGQSLRGTCRRRRSSRSGGVGTR